MTTPEPAPEPSEREAIRAFSHRMDDEAQGITERRMYDLATELRVLIGIDGPEAAHEVRAALKPSPSPVVVEPTAPRLPDGWTVTQQADLLQTVVVTAPNGYSAITTTISRNPENVLRMLVRDLMPHSALNPKRKS